MGRYSTEDGKNLDVNQVLTDLQNLDGSGSGIDADQLGSSSTSETFVLNSEVITFGNSLSEYSRNLPGVTGYVKIEEGFVNIYIEELNLDIPFLRNYENVIYYNVECIRISDNSNISNQYHIPLQIGQPFTINNLPPATDVLINVYARVGYLNGYTEYRFSGSFTTPNPVHSITTPSVDHSQPGNFNESWLLPYQTYRLTPFQSTHPNDEHVKTTIYICDDWVNVIKVIEQTEGDLTRIRITPDLNEIDFRFMYVIYHGLYGTSYYKSYSIRIGRTNYALTELSRVSTSLYPNLGFKIIKGSGSVTLRGTDTLFVIGGVDENNTPLTKVYYVNLYGGYCTVAYNLPNPVYNHDTVALDPVYGETNYDNDHIIVGGFRDNTTTVSDVVLFHGYTSSSKPNSSTYVTPLPRNVACHTVEATPDCIMVVGGITSADGNISNNKLIVSAPGFDPKDPFVNIIDELPNVPVYNHASSVLPDGTVLVTGGFFVKDSYPWSKLGNISNKTYFIASDGSAITEGPDLPYPVARHTQVTLETGHVLISGGVLESEFIFEQSNPSSTNIQYVFDPKTGDVKYINPLPHPVCDHIAGFSYYRLFAFVGLGHRGQFSKTPVHYNGIYRMFTVRGV